MRKIRDGNYLENSFHHFLTTWSGWVSVLKIEIYSKGKLYDENFKPMHVVRLSQKKKKIYVRVLREHCCSKRAIVFFFYIFLTYSDLNLFAGDEISMRYKQTKSCRTLEIRNWSCHPWNIKEVKHFKMANTIGSMVLHT